MNGTHHLVKAEGVIRGYAAFLDLARLGIGMTAIIGIEAAQELALVDMVAKIQEIPECERVYVVTGMWDILVQVRVRDQHHLSEVLFAKLWKIGGVSAQSTMIVLHRATTWDGYLPTLLDDLARTRGERLSSPISRNGGSRARRRSSGDPEAGAIRPEPRLPRRRRAVSPKATAS